MEYFIWQRRILIASFSNLAKVMTMVLSFYKSIRGCIPFKIRIIESKWENRLDSLVLHFILCFFFPLYGLSSRITTSSIFIRIYTRRSFCGVVLNKNAQIINPRKSCYSFITSVTTTSRRCVDTRMMMTTHSYQQKNLRELSMRKIKTLRKKRNTLWRHSRWIIS